MVVPSVLPAHIFDERRQIFRQFVLVLRVMDECVCPSYRIDSAADGEKKRRYKSGEVFSNPELIELDAPADGCIPRSLPKKDYPVVRTMEKFRGSSVD
jgi:hypothetical protein